MPKRNYLPEIPDYTGIPYTDDKLVVQKSNPLKSLSETGMSLAEFKLLDAYLSRIDSHNERKRFVRFEKGELEKILGVVKIPKPELDKRLEGLFKVVTIKDKYKEGGFTKIALFEKAEAKQDKDGLWQIDLICTPSAMEYIFNIENLGYLSYMLKNIVELTSRYSYILYLYLESRKKSKLKNIWQVPIDELRAMLNCTAARYEAYKYFNAEVLKTSHEELTKKTSLRFSYKPLKTKGRKYTHIEFTLEGDLEEIATPTSDDVLDGQISLDEVIDEQEKEKDYKSIYGSEELAILAEGVDYAFSCWEMEEISAILTRIKTPKQEDMNPFYAVIYGKQRYLSEKYAKLKTEIEKKEKKGEYIGCVFSYFKKMLENDTYKPLAYKKENEE